MINHFKIRDQEGGILCNYETGSGSDYTVSPETKAKQSSSAKINWDKEEHRNKILPGLREASKRTGKMRGENLKKNETWRANVKKANQSRENFEPWNKGLTGIERIVTQEERDTKAKFCRDHFTGPKTEEHRNKISEVVKQSVINGTNAIVKSGKENYMAKQILEFDLEMNFIIEYKSARQAAKINNVNLKEVFSSCRENKLVNNKFFKYK